MNMNVQQKVPVFILAGGLGTRISEETHLKPKPMIEIGDTPILLHIMRWYYQHGFDHFVICGGYRSWEIKNFFLNYEFRLNHLLIDHRESAHQPPVALGKNLAQEKWCIQIIDTGLETMTGARIARAFDEVRKQHQFDHFAVTYRHSGFWQPMDTLRDKVQLQGLWESGKAPWEPRNAIQQKK